MLLTLAIGPTLKPLLIYDMWDLLVSDSDILISDISLPMLFSSPRLPPLSPPSSRRRRWRPSPGSVCSSDNDPGSIPRQLRRRRWRAQAPAPGGEGVGGVEEQRSRICSYVGAMESDLCFGRLRRVELNKRRPWSSGNRGARVEMSRVRGPYDGVEKLRMRAPPVLRCGPASPGRVGSGQARRGGK